MLLDRSFSEIAAPHNRDSQDLEISRRDIVEYGTDGWTILPARQREIGIPVGVARKGFQDISEVPREFWAPLIMAGRLQGGSDLFGADHPERLDIGERGVVFFKLLIFIPGERMSAALTVGPRETVEALRIADRDRMQHIRVEEGEQRQVESEAKGDRSGDSEYEPRAAPETPQGIANVLQCGLE